MRTRALTIVLAGVACVACRRTEPPAPAAQHRTLADAPADGSDDVIVARVDGHPVWGSCVAAQAARTGGDRKAALRDCIDFEVLAWRAQARGFADDPDVIDATRTAMVSRVTATYEDTSKPADLQPIYNKLYERASNALRHPEYRGSSYLRVDVGSDATPETDAHAHEVMKRVAAALADQPGLTGADLLPIAQPIADAEHVVLSHDDVMPTLAIALNKPYATALYDISTVGRTAGPVRTKWGWDVVLFSSVVPAAEPTDDEVRAKVTPEARRIYFPQWVNLVAHDLGITPALEPDIDKTIEDAP